MHNIVNYKLFTTNRCPNCPAVKEFMGGLELKGEHIDASVPDGLDEAKSYGISTVPTVLFFDDKENIVCTARSVKEIKEELGLD